MSVNEQFWVVLSLIQKSFTTKALRTIRRFKKFRILDLPAVGFQATPLNPAFLDWIF